MINAVRRDGAFGPLVGHEVVCDSCRVTAARRGYTVVIATARARDDGWHVGPDRSGRMVHLCPRCSGPRGAA